MIASSSLPPNIESESARALTTPTTRKIIWFTATVRPTAGVSRNSSRCKAEPSTQMARSLSSGVRNRPSRIDRRRICWNSGVVAIGMETDAQVSPRRTPPARNISGATLRTPGCPRSTSMSAGVSVLMPTVLIGFMPIPPWTFPGTTTTMLAPSPSISAVTSCLAPCPIAVTTTTEATPMTMPSVVSSVRRRCCQSDVAAACRLLRHKPETTPLLSHSCYTILARLGLGGG
jgi:hypothetical protein